MTILFIFFCFSSDHKRIWLFKVRTTKYAHGGGRWIFSCLFKWYNTSLRTLEIENVKYCKEWNSSTYFQLRVRMGCQFGNNGILWCYLRRAFELFASDDISCRMLDHGCWQTERMRPSYLVSVFFITNFIISFVNNN